MAGIKIQKNYLNANIANVNIANHWTVLVFGVTDRGTTNPTLVKTYANFIDEFGQPVKDAPTHVYMRFLLENGVPVLFKRVINTDKVRSAEYKFYVNNDSGDEKNLLFTVKANMAYTGLIGNQIQLDVVRNEISGACAFQVYLEGEQVESFSLGQSLDDTDIGSLVYEFVKQASKEQPVQASSYVEFIVNDKNMSEDKFKGIFPLKSKVALVNGTEPENTTTSALDLLYKVKIERTDDDGEVIKDENGNIEYIKHPIYEDPRLLNAISYYPELRFCTTGGMIYGDDDPTKQEQIYINLGNFAVKCGTTFRILIDYTLPMTNLNTVRNFAKTVATKGDDLDPALYAYFGFYGADNRNNYLPGSAGFLTAIARGGYNVYSRRIAGTQFMPAYSKPYKEVFIDALNDWQNEEAIQLNPIMIIDSQDNLAVMGSSTLALPLNSLSLRNPSQALDVLCVSDYIAALLNKRSLQALEIPLDRLALRTLSRDIGSIIDAFVTSGAITRYDIDFDVTQLGKLDITVTLYFAVGLEEVSITLNSTYDTNEVTLS